MDESNFKPTPIHPLIHHFICKICTNIVRDGKQCYNQKCSVLYCGNCVKQKANQWKCPKCSERAIPVEIHNRVLEFMQILRFNCPGCSEQMLYTQIFKHVESCEEAKKH